MSEFVPRVAVSRHLFAARSVGSSGIQRPKPVLPPASGMVIQSAAAPRLQTPTSAQPAVQVAAVPPLNSQFPKTDGQAPPGRRGLALDMNLPGGVSYVRSAQTFIRNRRLPKVRHWAFRAGLALTVVAVGFTGLFVSQGYLKAHQVFKGGAGTAAALTTNVNPNLLKGEGDGRINVLLLGRGGGDHEGPDLTDSMMLASIDPVNHQATLLSIPRDLWVDVPDQGAMKINAAWETGEFRYLGKIAPGSTNLQAVQAGFSEVDQTVESVFGVPIDYNLLVDFQAFRQAVDTVGGVSVNVPTALIDPTMAWENHHSPVLAAAGLQFFDGSQALNYVRSRETTSDFARAQRQRSVLVALKSKVASVGTLSNPFKLASLMNTFGSNVASDLSLNDAYRLYGIGKGITANTITSIGLADSPNQYVTTGNINGQSVDLPTAGPFNYGNIQAYVRSQLKDGYIVKENAKVLVLNSTTVPGLATTETATLKSYGYDVVGAANAPSSGLSQTEVIDLSHGRDKYTAHYLEQRFGVKALKKMPDSNIQTNGADFVIILGNDAASNTET